MSALTNAQWHWLQWLYKHGGVAKLRGAHVVIGEQKSNSAASLAFLNLVAKGAVEGSNGELRITDYGKRLLAI